MFVLLVFFVSAATARCCLLLMRVNMEAREWPPETAAKFRGELNLPDTDIRDWINMQFTAKRTKVIGELIFYPFIVLAVMIVARSTLLANWTFSAGLTIVFLLSFVLSSTCAYKLRAAAERARRKAIEALKRRILSEKAKEQSTALAALEFLLKEIEQLREGAFRPITEQPLLRALLVPLGSASGLALVEYLVVMNL
jgi:hypothetical protein